MPSDSAIQPRDARRAELSAACGKGGGGEGSVNTGTKEMGGRGTSPRDSSIQQRGGQKERKLLRAVLCLGDWSTTVSSPAWMPSTDQDPLASPLPLSRVFCPHGHDVDLAAGNA